MEYMPAVVAVLVVFGGAGIVALCMKSVERERQESENSKKV